ncbi:hypothetical protein [Ekhidna sp.]|uniref:hypothetical protein n=1 Tax=Ekhidna sp. TaxID=2608089 RepID=UPI0032986F50
MNTFKKAWTLIIVLAAFSCQEQEIKKEPRDATHEIIHNYEYGSEFFTIIFEVDDHYQVLNKKGDLAQYEILQELMVNEEGILSIDEVSTDGLEITFTVIDSEDRRTYETGRVEQQCTNWHSPGGTASYFFYRDINYNQEFVDLRQPNCSYFQDQWLDGANDQISSFQIVSTGGNGALLAIFTDSCFYGWEFQFTTSVPNLHAVFIDWRNNSFLNPREWGINNLGDVTSSLKGWSL